LKLSLTNRLRILLTGEYTDRDRAFLTGEDVGDGSAISADMAMKYSAVSSCIRVRAETFASVPAVLYKKTDDGREPMTDLLIYDILHNSPNDEMAAFGFKETLLTNFDASGNIVCERLLNKGGQLVGLYPYQSDLVRIKRDQETKKLVYEIGSGADKKELSRDKVFHVPNLSFDGVIGMSPISYAASAIRLGLSYETYGVNFYRNAATPSGVFEHPTSLSDQAFDRLQKDINKNYTGLKNTGVPMILEEGMKWAQLTVNPVDAQLLESKYFQIEDICRIFRVPQHLVNKLDRSTFSNIEHLSLEFVMYTMLPIFKRFEDNINSQLLTKDQRKTGYYVEFKIDGLLRGDAKSRAEAYSIGRLGGWLSVNDIRKLENMPPIDNGNIYLEPLNYKEAGKPDDKVTAYNKLVEDMYNMITERRAS
jgi:HK97 family phage portal protein